MQRDKERPRQLIRRQRVMKLLDIKRSAFDEAIKRQDFPRPVRLFTGGRALVWAEDEVMEWIEARLAERAGAMRDGNDRSVSSPTSAT